MIPAAWSSGLIYVAVGAAVLIGTYFVARLAARLVGDRAKKRHLRPEVVVITRRVAMAFVVVAGIFVALSIAIQNSNVTLFGLLLGTIVAALGVQQLLQDYVSGYYVLLERHLRIGDHISFDGNEGTITDVRLRVTILKSERGDTIIVPNSELFTKPVTIHGRPAPEPKPEPSSAPPA